MCRMQETIVPQTTCKVPPYKGNESKKSFLPTLKEGGGKEGEKEARKEGGRHIHSMGFRQLAGKHSACEGHKYN